MVILVTEKNLDNLYKNEIMRFPWVEDTCEEVGIVSGERNFPPRYLRAIE